MADPLKPYFERYKNPNGPGDNRPTALEVIQDDGHIDQWKGRVVLITGGTSGIGIETARAMHVTGADVYITARDQEKARRVVDDIRKSSRGNGKLEIIIMHMESLESVKKAAQAFLSQSSKLNVLINNAGIMATPQSTTTDGFELQFGVNHLAHFVLTLLLLPTLLASAQPGFHSRVINLSSSSHRYTSIHFDDINLKNNYDPFLAYGQSKTANIWTANYIDRHYGSKGVHALSLNPGGIWTGLQVQVDAEKVKGWKEDKELMKLMLTPEQGAATTIWAAVGKIWEGKGGKYLAECTVAPPADVTQLRSAISNEVGPNAYNVEGEEELWELSCKLTSMTAP